MKNEFETAMVDEPSVFEPLKFYCICRWLDELWDFFKGMKNELETAMVDEPSVFEPLKFYCICRWLDELQFYVIFSSI